MLRTAVLLLAGCVGMGIVHAQPPAPAWSTGASQEAAALAVPDELRHALDTLQLDRPGVPRLERVRRLFEFMVSEDGLALEYRDQPTYDIAHSYARRQVNCLSFTMMFIALARAAGVDAYAQSSDDALALRVVDNTLFRARHVKAGVDIDGAQYTVDVGWRSVVAERHPRRITDVQLVALLHNNNAIESLAMGDSAKATAEIEVAVGLDPASATIWNNAGVIHWRSDRRSAAEHAYRQALQLEPAHIGALANLVEMYRASGEVRQSEQYQTRLRRAQISDPFSQFQMAQESMDLGAYARAISHYRRAIRLLPNQPMFHHSLADAYRKIGRESAAQRSIRRALSLERARFSQQSIPVTTAGSGSE